MHYTHFTLDERKYLQQLLAEGLSFRKIADILERSPSTISREVNRNCSKFMPRKKPNNKYWYNHWRAQNLYIRRRRECVPRAILPDTKEWDFILEGVANYWSPETIAGRWHMMFPDEKPLCVSTIYRYVKTGRLPNIRAKTHFRRKGKRIVRRDSNYNTIHPDRTIPEWDEAIRMRLRIGDFEGDTVYGTTGKGLLVTLVDRKSRFLFTSIIRSRNARETREAIERILKGVPVKSLSLDNGSEFSAFSQVENWGCAVYFAHPYTSWERPQNERHNGLFRAFVPKGVSIESFSAEYILAAADELNGRPRKKLGYRTPEELFDKFPTLFTQPKAAAASPRTEASGFHPDRRSGSLSSTVQVSNLHLQFAS